MAFEYSSQNRGIDFPNPLKMHNRFLVVVFAILGLFALAILFKVRNHLAAGPTPSSFLAIVLALALIAEGIRHLYTCFSHLRFFFGIGRPHGLAPEFTAEGQGTTRQAEHILKQTMRQQAITYREPKGPIVGLLYAAVPNLIYAPEPLRQYAECQFKGGLTLVTLLVGLISTLIIGVPSQGGRVSNVGEWVGIIFVFVGVWTLIRQDFTPDKPSVDSGFLSVQWVSLLIAFAVVGPVIFSLLLTNFPFLPPLHPFPHVFFFLVGGIALHVLFFAAIVTQLLPPPPTAVSVIQETWNLSTSPAQITGEFLRAMQESWREKIPNRRYARIEPNIDLNASAGAFNAEIIEETQPFPSLINAISEEQIQPSGSRMLILALDAVGVFFVVGAGLTSYLMSGALLEASAFPATTALYAVACWALSSYALYAARRLWLRFDFESRLFWLDMGGQYVSARVSQGNVIQGKLSSSSSMVQVEGMTFRLWMAEIHTVTFGKDAPRYIVSMAGNPEVAEGLVSRLKQFTDGVASVVALNNRANAERLASNNLLSNRLGKAGAISTSEVTAALGERADEQ